MKNEIGKALQDAAGKRMPPFAETWQAAETRYAVERRRYRRIASAAAVVAFVAIAVSLQTEPDETASMIEVAELLESTSWSAPSDVLLPERQFDIYQDMPKFESTDSAGGTLL